VGEYTSILSPVPWDAVGVSMLQTVVIYWLLLFGLKAVERRVFAEMGPHDLVVLMMIAEAASLGLTVQRAGFWGALGSVLVILLLGAVIERLPQLRGFIANRPVVLYEGGTLQQATLQRYLVDESDLDQVARMYGLPTYKAFECLTLESDGSITGVVRTTVPRIPRRLLRTSRVC
jgi:uncharacterized membrane protein YcaP (DUF421 family)